MYVDREEPRLSHVGLSREVGSFRQAPDNYEDGGSAAAEKDLFAFGLFKVSYESILVFP